MFRPYPKRSNDNDGALAWGLLGALGESNSQHNP